MLSVEDWTYFRWVSGVLGALMVLEATALQVLGAPTVHAWVSAWMPPRRPLWLPVAVLVALALPGHVAYRAYLDEAAHGWVLVALLSPSLLKAYCAALHYEGFRAWVLEVFSSRRRTAGLALFVRLFGFLLLGLAVFLY